MMVDGLLKIEGQIERVNGKKLSYRDFAETYLAKNQPVVLTGLMDGWKACTDWVTDDGRPNLPTFSACFGNSIVQVAECGTREFSDQKRLEMTVAEFIDKWGQNSAKNTCNGLTGECKIDSPLLYLKDWHLVKEFPEYLPYTTPLFFNDDWLNLYLDSFLMHKEPDNNQEKTEICCSDYRFVYMGPKGSWTPLHADVFRSYSWSANVCGQKKWFFLSPSQSHLIFDRNMKISVYNIFEEVDEKKFPGLKKAIWLECIQEKDEIIFVPSGWFHQVHNLEDTISINHNWFNAYNLSWVWDLLLRDYNEAKEYIEDIRDICDDFEGLCQRNLAINTGMNFYDYFVLIARFTYASVVLLCFLLRDNTHISRGLYPVIRNLYLNLTSTRHIALRMGSEKIEESGLELDLMTCFEDPEFHQLCMSMGRTYGVIHQKKLVSHDIKDLSMDNLKTFATEVPASHVHTPDDLIKFIDYIVTKLGVAIYCEEKACEAYSD